MRKRTKIWLVAWLSLACLPACSQEIGLQLYSLRNEFKTLGVEKTLETISQWGIEVLEDGNDGTHGLTMQAYKELLAKNGLKIVSASAPFEELRDNPEKAISRAKAYGARYLVCFWIPHEGDAFTIQDVEKALEVFNKAGRLMQAEGITLAYHPHGYEFRPYGEAMLMDYMIENATDFEFEMDVYWFALPGEDPLAWLRKYPDRFKLMHLKDCKKGTPQSHSGTSDDETNVVLGEGSIDIAALVAEARKLQMEYLFIEDESSRVLKQVPKSLEFLKNLE